MPGSWEDRFDFGPGENDRIVAVHLVHLYTGKILAYDHGAGNPYSTPRARLWTPPPMSSPGGAGTYQPAPNDRTNLFCCGHSHLADGRVFHAGGHFRFNQPNRPATRQTDLFVPATATWNAPTQPPDMAWERWYPTCTTLPNGRVLVTAGFRFDGQNDHAEIPELYDPATNTIQELTSAERWLPLYPSLFVLPSGLIAFVRATYEPRLLDPATWTWQTQTHPIFLDAGSAVTYEPGKIMMCGGREPSGITGMTAVIDFNAPTPAWTVAQSMHFPRHHHNLVLLPDGKILAVGGNSGEGLLDPVREPEIFDPDSLTWQRTFVEEQDPRRYHSTAMLLSDGRVVSAGADNFPTAQIFRPPYLDGDPQRPGFTTPPPETLAYDQWFPFHCHIGGSGAVPVIKAIRLIRLGAVTHGFDQDQRTVPLQFTQDGSLLKPKSPPNSAHAPPGYYMLFIVDAAGVPSIGKYVQLV